MLLPTPFIDIRNHISVCFKLMLINCPYLCFAKGNTETGNMDGWHEYAWNRKESAKRSDVLPCTNSPLLIPFFSFPSMLLLLCWWRSRRRRRRHPGPVFLLFPTLSPMSADTLQLDCRGVKLCVHKHLMTGRDTSSLLKSFRAAAAAQSPPSPQHPLTV